jgi:hypothetical protein
MGVSENVVAIGEIFREVLHDYRRFHGVLEVQEGCKTIYVPAVTVQSDRDLQQCAVCIHFLIILGDTESRSMRTLKEL